MPSHTIHEGDALSILRTLPSDHYHGSLTDPPYGLSFMGHGWDHGVPSVDVWREVLRVLRPGAHVLAFGGTRTFHRLTCAIEDAGFEIRDCMQWLYGSGFPKSHDVSKAIDREAGAEREVIGRGWHHGTGNSAGRTTGKWADTYKPGDAAAGAPITAPATEAARQWSGHGTALKPAWEPIIVARKPIDGTVAQNVQRWGCGGLAIDACRVGDGGQLQWSTPRDLGYSGGSDSDGVATPNALGRWPANVILDEEAGAILDAQTEGKLHSAGSRQGPQAKWAKASTGGTVYGNTVGAGPCGARFGDTGGASRFFYQAKASRAERDAGLEEFEAAQSLYTRGTGLKANGDGSERSESRNIHPTVKPIALARYLARLILPPIPNARMLTPFSGSGSEVIGALQAGWSHVDGIDSWDVAVRISRARIAHWASRIEPVQLDLAGE
jgi:site-specific DNA-methyltransferase (adenine-specific)